jgi:hypothetical protein
MTVTIRALHADDMLHLATGLRPMDRLELVSMAPGRPIADVLLEAANTSVRCRAGFLGSDLVACWGIAPRSPSGGDGAPWLLATHAIDHPEVRRAFIAHGGPEMLRITHGFRHLWNLVHRENAVARRWLRFMGFEFRDPREYVFSGQPFVRFEMENA